MEQLAVWGEGFGRGQRSGAAGPAEQVPQRDAGAGSLLARDGGAVAAQGARAGVLVRMGAAERAPARGVAAEGAGCRVLDRGPVCGVGETEQGPAGGGDGAGWETSTHSSVPTGCAGGFAITLSRSLTRVGAYLQVPGMAGAKAAPKSGQGSNTLPIP